MGGTSVLERLRSRYRGARHGRVQALRPPKRLALSVALLVAAYGSSPAGKPPGDGGFPGSSGDIAATVVGPAGATLCTQAVVLNIPVGALTADVAVAASRLDAARIAGLPAPGIDGTGQLSAEVFAFTRSATDGRRQRP